MHISNNLIVASLFVIASSFVHAGSNSTSHPLTTINSQDDFCMFLPPKPGLVVAVNEENGIPFCVNKGTVPNDTPFPNGKVDEASGGFITTAHYLKTSTYVQVTGFLDRSKYNLGANDGGGQYDNHAHGKPVGAECKGYNYFVNLIEPDVQRFCIRCCQDKVDCNTGRSGYGCLRVVPGDYTQDNNFINDPSSKGNSTKTSSKKSKHNHNNSSMNSVYAELDALPSTTDGDSTATHDDDSTTTQDDDSTTTQDDSTTTQDDDSTTTQDDDSTTTQDNDSNTTQDDNTTATNTNANQEIATETVSLKKDLASQAISVDEIQTRWKTFATELNTKYPQISEQVDKLSNITIKLTTSDEWDTFLSLLYAKITQLQDNDSTNTTEDATVATTTDSHTNSPEDLEWLFGHRNSHDNQANW